MKHLMLIVSVLIFTLLACSEKPTETDIHPIIGNWNWIESTGGFGGWTRNPESEGYYQTISFSVNNLFIDSKTDSSNYFAVFEIKKEDVWGEDSEVLYVYGDEERMPMKITLVVDTLVLTDLCSDCYIHRYIRLGNI